MIINPKGEEVQYALIFGLKTSNNEVEYKALIIGLKLAKALCAKNVNVKSDS